MTVQNNRGVSAADATVLHFNDKHDIMSTETDSDKAGRGNPYGIQKRIIEKSKTPADRCMVKQRA